jgi:hypothetical protein
MASRDTVMETLRAQNARFTHEKAAASFKGWTRVMRYVFPDIGLSATITVTDGVPAAPVECDAAARPGGGTDAAQISYEMSSDTFLAIARKEITGMQAYTRKLVKVKASMGDLLKLQRLDAL